jgi:hypothetical protein
VLLKELAKITREVLSCYYRNAAGKENTGLAFNR